MQFTVSETARAVKRLYELKGIEGQGHRGDLTSFTVSEVAKEIGKSEPTVRRLRTLADLVPELAAMLDHAPGIAQACAGHLPGRSGPRS